MSDSESVSGSSSEDDEKKDPNYVDWKSMENIRVICRFRPINSREMREEKSAGLIDKPPIIENGGSCVKVHRQERLDAAPMEFYLDKILPTNTTQQNLYLNVGRPMVEACLEGYNTTIFAYGQTGSGKTYTMFGPEKLKSNNELGCVQRCLSFLFQELVQRQESKRVTEWKVLLHFVQLYREQLMDLLEPDKGIGLKIRYDPKTDSPYVPNLKQVDVTELAEVIKLLAVANRNRVVDKTLMNAESSRSHMIMTLNIEQTLRDGTVKTSKLNFADLAGSETYEKALGGTRGQVDRKKIEELKTINLSLTNLTTCINYLSKGRKASYRSSQLTFYLMDSLGGNSKTTLIVAASPHIFNRSETIRTLRFAKTAKSVKNNAKVNKELSKAQLEALVKKLQRENKKLKARLALFEAELIKNGIELPADVAASKSGKKKKHKRSKSMKTLLTADTKKNIFGTSDLNTSTVSLLTSLTESTEVEPDKTDKGSKKNSNQKLKQKQALLGKVDESAYNKLKSQLTSFQEDLANAEKDNNLLNEQLKKKNIELEDLMEEIEAEREKSSQLDVLEESKNQITMQLQAQQEEFIKMKQLFDQEREKMMEDKEDIEEELNETKNDIQQYESIMDNMKLSNSQLKQEVESLRETINTLQQQKEEQNVKTEKKMKKNKEELNKANEILSKYFTVANTKKMNDKQLDDTENKLESLSAEIISVTKQYEQFTGQNFSFIPQTETSTITVEPASSQSGLSQSDDQQSNDHSIDDRKSDNDHSINNHSINNHDKKSDNRKSVKRSKTPRTSSALASRMAMFGGGGGGKSKPSSPRKKKRRKSKPKNKVKEYADSIVKTDPKKNLVFQTERLTHYLNSAMTTIDKQKKLHSQELESKLNQKNSMITNLEIENKGLKERLDLQINQKNDEIEELKRKIQDLQEMSKQSSMLTARFNEDEEDDDEFVFGDQLAYLANIGKGFDDEVDQFGGPQQIQQAQTSVHNPTQIALWRQQLQIGSKLDCLDEGCLWWTAMVTDSDGYRIKVRYDGFDARWDEWVDRGSTRIAPYKTKAKGGRESKGVSVNLKVVGKKKDKRTGKTRKVYKQGFLVKQGKRFKSYKTRYFTLMDDGTMEYFKKMTDQTPAGSFSIKNMVETRKIAYPNKKDLYGFEIVTKERTWRFQAHSDDVVADWIGVIHAVSKGVEPDDDDDEQHAVIYSGFSDTEMVPNDNNINININGNKTNGDYRRATVQATNTNHLSSNPNGRNVRSFTQLSIQEESSSHPPINRAGFSQLMNMNMNDPNDDDTKSDDGQSIRPSLKNNLSNISIPSNNKSRPDESLVNGSSPLVKTDDEKDTETFEQDKNIQHSGWMHKAGKWDANWTYRYCVLTVEPVTLRCYVAPNKKQTHCIDFKNVKSCIELKKNSEKFGQLEIPTAFAFQLITSSRIYTFACKSRHDVNVWLKKIRKIVDVSANANTAKLSKRSSMIRFGSTLNKLGTSFGRLIGVTQEHVTTTEVLKTENVQIQKNKSPRTPNNINNNNNNLTPLSQWSDINLNKNIMGLSSDRRASLPVLPTNWDNNQNIISPRSTLNGKGKSRRKSAPDLRALANPQYNKPINLNDLENELAKNNQNFNSKQFLKEQFNKEIGTRHRGSMGIIADRDLLKQQQDIAHSQQRHTISGKSIKSINSNKKGKKNKTQINDHIASVLQDNASNDYNTTTNTNNQNTFRESEEEDLSDME